MKSNFKYAKEVLFRLICCGVASLLVYSIISVILSYAFTKEVGAYVYEEVNGEYTLISEETFKNKSDYTPPEGDNIYVEYYRNELPIVVKVISSLLLQAVFLHLVFSAFSAILAQPGHRAKVSKQDTLRGLKIGIIAAVPAFCLFVAYFVATALKIKFAKPVYLILNIVFRPIIDLILLIPHKDFSLINASFMLIVVLLIPIITQLAFKYGHSYQNYDFKKFMYKKEEKK